MVKKDGQKRMASSGRRRKVKRFLTSENAAEIAARRKLRGGGRPRIPTVCQGCGVLHPSARMAQACLHETAGTGPPGALA